MEVQFIKTNPTQNMTILVESRHTRDMYRQVASRIMAYDNVFAEQVGFIESPQNEGAWTRLQMMAGEFCGNAALSLAAVMAWRKNLRPGNQLEVPLEVSGSNELLVCRVEAQQTGYLCRANIPLPLSIHKRNLCSEGSMIPTTIVRFQGIVHAVMDVPTINSSTKEMAQLLVKSPELLQGESASGIMLYQRQNKELFPLVYMPDEGTMIWERGCGSGAASIAACLAQEAQQDIHVRMKQPGGTVEVWAQYQQEKVTRLQIEGHVDISAIGTAFI